MLHRLLYANWEDPPESMGFEVSYREAIYRIAMLLETIIPGKDAAMAAPATMPPSFWKDCLELYLLAPALVNVALNYKICVEQGLPLHATHYFEVTDKTRLQVQYPPEQLQRAQDFFLESIAIARAAFALDPELAPKLPAFEASLPAGVSDFIFTSTQDKYTWRASDPKKIAALAESVNKVFRPVAIVGAAHGSIMSGLLLANLLNVPLYYIRFSMFKRKDTAPIISQSDLGYLATYREGPVLLFDEDVAKGTTLTHFTNFLAPFFQKSYSAGVLRHGHASFRPDFTGHVWYD
ncbi:MAG: phosphoribosyltransferase [Holophaga sp.]|nr:phosphoribosyltransferase [Holophaga sp.]